MCGVKSSLHNIYFYYTVILNYVLPFYTYFRVELIGLINDKEKHESNEPNLCTRLTLQAVFMCKRIILLIIASLSHESKFVTNCHILTIPETCI